jgi:insulysin
MPGQPDVDAEGAADGDGGPAGRETRRRLLEWYEKEYCASRMSLAVIGKQTLDELTELTLKFFNDVKTRNVPVPIPPNEVKLVSPWTAEQEGVCFCYLVLCMVDSTPTL